MSDVAEPSPYRMTLHDFEEQVSVSGEVRIESVGLPQESTPMSGDEAQTMRWNSGAGVAPPGNIVTGDADGD